MSTINLIPAGGAHRPGPGGAHGPGPGGADRSGSGRADGLTAGWLLGPGPGGLLGPGPDGLMGAVTGERMKATVSSAPVTDRPRRTPTWSARKPMAGGPARKAREPI